MSGMLPPGAVVRAGLLDLAHEALPAAEVVDGAPATGWTELGAHAGCVIGVWEMSPGTATDVEVDEVFVVLGGSARVEFLDPALPEVELRAGDVVRLSAGMRTRWTVSETLRKVSIA